MARILITGSRDWDHGLTIHNAIKWHARNGDVIVHGACPTGADSMADSIARMLLLEVESHPADWETYGKAAGPLRNQHMVDLGVDLCLAFPLGASRGTRDCMRRARAAGIDVINYGSGSDHG